MSTKIPKKYISRIINNNQNEEKVQVPTRKWTDKEILVYSCKKYYPEVKVN